MSLIRSCGSEVIIAAFNISRKRKIAVVDGWINDAASWSQPQACVTCNATPSYRPDMWRKPHVKPKYNQLALGVWQLKKEQEARKKESCDKYCHLDGALDRGAYFRFRDPWSETSTEISLVKGACHQNALVHSPDRLSPRHYRIHHSQAKIICLEEDPLNAADWLDYLPCITHHT